MHKLAGTHITGLVRGKRGFPEIAWQAVLKSQRAAATAKGTVKTASLLNGSWELWHLRVVGVRQQAYTRFLDKQI